MLLYFRCHVYFEDIWGNYFIYQEFYFKANLLYKGNQFIFHSLNLIDIPWNVT